MVKNAALLAVVLVLGGCAAVAGVPPGEDVGTSDRPPSCRPLDPAPCPGPVPAPEMTVSADGYEISGAIGCGESFELTRQTPTTVRITYRQQPLAPGAGSCTHIQAFVRLAQPLGTRVVEDGATGGRIRVVHAST